tara:strand:- start:1538 stop:1768 length:231 start_codon:yes stop_codon:yes gene_type:complete
MTPQTHLENSLDYQQFEALAMPLMIFALVAFMGYIVWDLAKRSKAGRYGTMVLFFGLGLGVVGFVIKAIIIGNVEG